MKKMLLNLVLTFMTTAMVLGAGPVCCLLPAG